MECGAYVDTLNTTCLSDDGPSCFMCTKQPDASEWGCGGCVDDDAVKVMMTPKGCNKTGSCLACTNHTQRAGLEASRSDSTQLYLSAECNYYVPGGVVNESYTVTRARRLTVFAGGGTLVGQLNSSVPTVIDGLLHTHAPVHYTGSKFVADSGIVSTADVALIVTETTADVRARRLASARWAAAVSHVSGTVTIDECVATDTAQSAVVTQSLASDSIKYTMARTCPHYDLSRLLNVFGQKYEVVFNHGDAADSGQARAWATYTSLAAGSLAVLLCMTHGDLLAKIARGLGKGRRSFAQMEKED